MTAIHQVSGTEIAACARADGGWPDPGLCHVLSEAADTVQARWGWGSFAIRSGGALVGFCGLKPGPDPAFPEVGYGLDPAAHGRGHATRALRALQGIALARGCTGIWAQTAPDHTRSVAVLRRCGFLERGDRWVWHGNPGLSKPGETG